jgi:transposase
MEQKKKQKYSPEFKAEILEMVASGRAASEIAREYGIPAVTISNWRRGSNDLRHKVPQTEEQAEISRLKAENRHLQMELDILKKAMAIISKT